MEATATSLSGQDRPASHDGAGPGWWADARRDLLPLLFLLVLAAALRGWLIAHTEVTARDSIGFIRYAMQLEEQPLTAVLRGNHQHPGYATVLLAVSKPVRAWTGVTDSMTMQLSAQLASALAGVLLVIPMYYFGKSLFGCRVGFWSTALFQCLPVSGRVLADGLSEAVFFFWMACALLAAVHALRSGSWLLGGLCGLLGGLAYLTRPEGAFVIAATGLVLFGAQAVPTARLPWRRAFACGAALGLGAILVGGPYAYTIGWITPKPTARGMLTGEQVNPRTDAGPRPGEVVELATAGRPLAFGLVRTGPLFAERGQWLTPGPALRAVAKEMQKGFNYVGWVPAVLALWWFRGRLRTTPGLAVPLVLCLLHTLVVWRMAMVVGYVSERHVLVVVLCGVVWAAAGLDELPRRLSRLRARRPGLVAWLPAAIMLMLLGASLPKTVRPLHANRAGHHAAGRWLADHADPADHVFDPFSWAHYYAGRVFTERQPPAPPPGHQPKTYVVLEPRDDLPERRGQLAQARSLAEQGQLVFHWPEHTPGDRADVQVFAVPRAAP